jgi:hypothetical protein
VTNFETASNDVPEVEGTGASERKAIERWENEGGEIPKLQQDGSGCRVG